MSTFVGRERELERLLAGLDASLDGRGRLFLVGGEPGIGKSRLADELTQKARERGAGVVVGRCWEAGGAPAFWPWVQAIRARARERDLETLRTELGPGAAYLAQIVPELRELFPALPDPPALDTEGARFQLFEAVAGFLRSTAEPQALVLVLDDLHAADEPSLLLLQFLARELVASRLLVFAAYRDVDPTISPRLSASLAELIREPATQTIALGGLDEPEVSRFIQLTTGRPPVAGLAAAVFSETEGNPLFVSEMARLLASEGALEQVDAVLAIPPSVKEVIGRRLQHLSEECNRLLALASVLGREFDLDAVTHVSGLEASALLGLLDDAMAARVLSELPGAVGRLRFAHQLIRDTLYESLPVSRRLQLHLEVGQALEALHAGDLDPHLAELALHFFAAAPVGGTERAIEYARRAGDRAVRLLAYEEAVRLYELALKLVEDDTVRCELLLAIGDAQARSGDTPASKDTNREAAEIAETLGLPEHLARAALGYGGRFTWEVSRDDAYLVPLLEKALSALGDADSPLRVRLLARLAGGPLRDTSFPPERKRALSREALDMARRLDDRGTLAFALDGYMAAHHSPEHTREQLKLATELARVANEVGDRERELEGYEARLVSYVELGEIGPAKADLEAMAKLAEELRQPSQDWSVAVHRALLALLEGRLAAAEELIFRARGLGERAQSWSAAVSYGLQLYVLRWEQGRLAEVEEVVRTSVREYPTYPVWRCVLAHLEAELGRKGELWKLLETALPFDEEWLVGMGFLAEAAASLGDQQAARILYEPLLPYADRVTVSYPEISTGSVSRYLGLLASTTGRWDDAERHFEEALEIHERIGAKGWLARTRANYAAMLLERRGPDDEEHAVELLGAALATARELGMARVAEQAAELLTGEGTTPLGLAGYRMEGEIARGGMGVVYRATDVRLERPVALKVIAPELAEDPDFRERFLHESRLAASLDHPNVVPIYEAGEADGQLFIAMRYVDGSDLKALLATERQLPAERALAICNQVAAALDAAHAKGLVHRDVKPANVLLDGREHAYLADFGLSKQAGGASTQTGRLIGTLDYLAPEQIRGDELDGRSDEYALACVLCECLAGTPPFRRPTEAEMLWAHMQEQPPPLRAQPELDPIVARALAKERTDRYPTCGEFVDAAREALGLETPRLRRRRRLIRRSRALLAAGALVLAGGIAALVVELTGGTTALASIAPNSVGAIDPGSNTLVAQTPVGYGPIAVAVGEGSVWVANATDQTVSRIDPATRRVVGTVGTGRTPSAIAVGDGAVWVANALGERGTVSRIEPQSNQVVATAITRRGIGDPFAPPSPNAIAVGRRIVWTNSNPRAVLDRFSPSSGARRTSVFLGRDHSADGVAVGEGAVWVSSSADDSVLRVDEKSGRVTATIRVAAAGEHVAGPYGIAVGEGSVWVADSLANTVSRIDPRLRTVAATIKVGLRPTDVAVGEGGVWVLDRGDGTVSRIDPKTNEVTAVVHVGGRPTGIAAGAGAVWVTVAGGNAPVKTVAPRVATPLATSSCSPPIYGGSSRPRVLIASDLPRRGDVSPVTAQITRAIRLVLEQRHFRAGRYTVAYQSCDDSSRAGGDPDPVQCAANARAFAGDPSLLALVGSYISFCSGIQLPITNTSPSGPLATISPSNTYVGLTTSGPATTPLEPDQYYPSGVRSFARVVGNDQAQGAADALLAKQLGLRRIYLLDDGTGTAVADATYTGRAATRLGVRVAGRATWPVDAKRYVGLARKVASARPDGIYVAGCICLNGVRLLRDLKAVLGPSVTYFAPDNIGVTGVWFGQQPTAGLYESTAGEPVTRLAPAGKRFVTAYRARYGEAIAAGFVVTAAQAAEIALDAIARSDGTRASVVRELLRDSRFDRNGDPTRSPFTIYRFRSSKPTHKPPYVSLEDSGGVVDRVIVAPARLAAAPRS